MKKSILFIFISLACVCGVSAQVADVLKSDAISAESQEQYAQAAEFFEKAHAAYEEAGTPDTTCLYRAGMNYVKIKQYDKALPLLEKVIGMDYNPGRSARLLADAYVGTGKAAEAEAALLKGKEAVPSESVEFDKKLAYLYFNTGQYEKAAASFATVNEAIPGNKNYMYLYGFSLERIQKYDEAIEVFRNAQELFPGEKRTKKLLGVTLFEKTDEENAKVVANYEANKGANIGDYVAVKKRLEQVNAGYEEARVILEESLVNYPNDQMIVTSLYKIYLKQEKNAKAEEMKKLIQQ